MMEVRNVNKAPVFTTKDGSEIRELLAHRNSCMEKQSLAEARLPAGGETIRHYHKRSEEIYYLLHGEADMHVGGDTRRVGLGDAIAIPAGQIHYITNVGISELRFLCMCSPAYEDDDTVLVDG